MYLLYLHAYNMRFLRGNSENFQEHDLLQHNLVVFRNGENAIQVVMCFSGTFWVAMTSLPTAFSP